MTKRLLSTFLTLPALCVLVSAASAHEHGGDAADGKTMAGGEFHMMDTNGDGKVSQDEHAAGAKKMFEAMDADKDGKVTAAEMDAAHERMGKMMGKAHQSEHKGMAAADKIKAIDTDKDGVLTADEHAAGARLMFEKMDADKDGYLSQAELEAGHAKLMSKGPHQATDKAPPKTEK